MKTLYKDNHGVSEVVGYALSLGVMTMLVTGAYFITDAAVDNKVKIAAGIQAQNVADDVADSLINAFVMYQNYPTSNYTRTVKLPGGLAGLSYYIEVNQDWVFVNTTNGQVKENSSLHNLPENSYFKMDHKMYGANSELVIKCPASNPKYKFDFGPYNSTSPWDKQKSYIRISNLSKQNIQWPPTLSDEWEYCNRINISNPTNKEIRDYPILVRLDPSNFDYSKANQNGSDLRFHDENNNELDFWIERWNPKNTSTSRIWVKIPAIPGDGCYIYMYYGNDTATFSGNNDGNKVFPFFEDFEVADTTSPDSCSLNSDWDFENECNISDGMLVLENTSSGDAIATVTSKNISDGVIESKVKATDDRRDASIFARDNDSGDWRYIFHNGNWTNPTSWESYNYFNCSVSKNYTSSPLEQLPKATDSGNTPISKNRWHRLIFTINGSDYVGARYLYDSFGLDAYANWSNTDDNFLGNCNDGRFGLINQHGAPSYFDWVFLRPFQGDTSVSSNAKPEDQYPTAYIGGTVSQSYFQWNNTDSLETEIRTDVSNDLTRDHVGCTDSRYFNVSGLKENTVHTLLFKIGDTKKDIKNMKITVNGAVNGEVLSIPDLDAGDYTTKAIDVESNSTGGFEIKFESSHFWNICSLQIEQNVREIEMKVRAI
ncbi:MAG: DUF2341 domain-containing protein [Candidatus Thermoplasmatota archaeon]